MSTSALRAALQPDELHRLARTAVSPGASPDQRAGAVALLELLAAESGGGTPTTAPPPSGTMPVPPVVEHLHQVLPASTLEGLAQLRAAEAAAGRSEAHTFEEAADAFEDAAGMVRPERYGTGDVSALSGPASELAWLGGDVDLAEVRFGYGDATVAGGTGRGAHHGRANGHGAHHAV